jgi:HAD superfamily hydrolase (TIGR01509 family)
VGNGRPVAAVAILDIDGTLVDSNYHHALAWYRAFRQQGLVVPMWRIHQRMGMGGDLLVGDLCGERVERELGEEIRAAEKPLYLELAREVVPIPCARELIEDVGQRGLRVILASSGKPYEVDMYIEMLGARELIEGWTTSADVERSKPAPDLVHAVLERTAAEPGDAVLVGDSVWDCRAARAAGVETIAVLTGGFCAEQLRAEGAGTVFESLEDLRAELDETPLGRPGAVETG